MQFMERCEEFIEEVELEYFKDNQNYKYAVMFDGVNRTFMSEFASSVDATRD